MPHYVSACIYMCICCIMRNQLRVGMWRTSTALSLSSRDGSDSSRESTRVPCRLSVCLLPDVWKCGFPVDLTRHNGRAHSDRRCHISRSEAEQLVHDSSNKEQPGPGIRQTAVAIAAGRLPLVQDELQRHLPLGRNRTPLKGVTVRPLPANTLGLQTMEQS